MKFVMTSSVSFMYATHSFEKPLNPILGETLEGSMEDGSRIYMEQITHHPPISYTLIEGPGSNYRAYAWSMYTPKAHMNSIELHCKGYKVVEFPDGSKIEYNPSNNMFQNTIWGTLRHIVNGKVEFKDEVNGIYGWMELAVKGSKKPSDYFVGEIKDRNGNVLSKMNGTYFGYADFDG